MSKYRSFVFESYDFDANSGQATFRYSMDGQLYFEEIIGFGQHEKNYNESELKAALELLFFVTGVSYYKTYLPAEITVKSGLVTPQRATFLSKTYQKGLGEFFYTNQLDPKTTIDFPINTDATPEISQTQRKGFLVAVGGGKDSLVSIETLRSTSEEPIETWSLNHEQQLKPLVERIGTKHHYVSRQIDQKLLHPEQMPGSYNGHVPISAIFGCVGVVLAILTEKRDVVMSNERSADEATLIYRDTEVNHQYSKSSEYENAFQTQLESSYGQTLRYYSLLRPLCEVQIAKLFCERIFNAYYDVFSSCNRAFVHGSDSLYWDEACPKCAFIYLIFSPFLTEQDLKKIFTENLLLKPSLRETYRQLLGLTDEKPLECIGETNESRWALLKAMTNYPELADFGIKNAEDVFFLGTHTIPEDVAPMVLKTFEQI